jgi:hypothetical protein
LIFIPLPEFLPSRRSIVLIWSPLTPPVAADAPLVAAVLLPPLVDVLPPELPHAATPIDKAARTGAHTPANSRRRDGGCEA